MSDYMIIDDLGQLVSPTDFGLWSAAWVCDADVRARDPFVYGVAERMRVVRLPEA